MTVHHDTARRRFLAPLPEGEAYLSYVREGDALDIQHTVVPEAAEGRGVGSALVRAAVAYARGERLRVIPSCPFARHWLSEHAAAGDAGADRA